MIFDQFRNIIQKLLKWFRPQFPYFLFFGYFKFSIFFGLFVTKNFAGFISLFLRSFIFLVISCEGFFMDLLVIVWLFKLKIWLGIILFIIFLFRIKMFILLKLACLYISITQLMLLYILCLSHMLPFRIVIYFFLLILLTILLIIMVLLVFNCLTFLLIVLCIIIFIFNVWFLRLSNEALVKILVIFRLQILLKFFIMILVNRIGRSIFSYCILIL